MDQFRMRSDGRGGGIGDEKSFSRPNPTSAPYSLFFQNDNPVNDYTHSNRRFGKRQESRTKSLFRGPFPKGGRVLQ